MTKLTLKQFSEEVWITAVQVATVWTNPESPRTIDTHAITNPTDIESWIAGLTYETNVALCDENRIQTQLLYGELVQVIEIKGDWAHVVIPSQPSSKDERGYPGWVPLAQLAKVNKADWVSTLTAAVVEDKVWLENQTGDQQIKLSYMTLLPVLEKEETRVAVNTPNGKLYLPTKYVHIFPTEKGIAAGYGESVVQAGIPYVGLDYLWGGMSAFGYDCSGLAYAVHKANGYQIPRDAGDQATQGKSVAFDQLRPGDLLFFAYEEGKGSLHHVGIYYGEGKMLHSPQTGKGIEIITLEGTFYQKELCAATRYWREAKEK